MADKTKEQEKYKNVPASEIPDEILAKHGLKRDSSGRLLIQGSKNPVAIKRRKT